MDLQQPTLMALIIDQGVAKRDLHYVLLTGRRMVIFAFAGLLGGAGCSLLSTFASNSFAGEVRKALFAKIQSLPLARLDGLGTGSLITRITNDAAQVQQMMQRLLRAGFRGPMLSLGSLGMALLLSPRLAVILLGAVFLEACAVVIIVRRATPRFSLVQRCVDKINRLMRENLLGIRVVKAFVMEDRQFRQFKTSNRELAETSVFANKAAILLNPVVLLIMNLATVAALWYGGWMQIKGLLDTGIIMAFVNYMVQIGNSLRMLVMLTVGYSRAAASAHRINAVLQIPLPDDVLACSSKYNAGRGLSWKSHRSGRKWRLSNRQRPSDGFSMTPATLSFNRNSMTQIVPDVMFQHVSFHYAASKVNALTSITCCFRGGSKTGIIGATGSGKSTLINLITRLYDVTEGGIRLGAGPASRDLREISTDELRSLVAVVPQESLLFSGTVADNLRYGCKTDASTDADDSTLWEALEAAQAADFIRALPAGLESPVEQRGRNFSGGQRQRLTVARTLLCKAPILILDDASSALDLDTDARMREAIGASLGSSSLIIVAQRVASLWDCDTILVLDAGRLVAQGRHEELLETCPLYRDIAVSQLGEEILRGGRCAGR
jgi:ATP-binding cassette subfamily B protein